MRMSAPSTKRTKLTSVAAAFSLPPIASVTSAMWASYAATIFFASACLPSASAWTWKFSFQVVPVDSVITVGAMALSCS